MSSWRATTKPEAVGAEVMLLYLLQLARPSVTACLPLPWVGKRDHARVTELPPIKRPGTAKPLAEVGLTVADIDLGGFDAESDHKLAEDFIETPVVGAALKGRKQFFLGRKGSGKSALFSQMAKALSRVARTGSPRHHARRLRVDSAALLPRSGAAGGAGACRGVEVHTRCRAGFVPHPAGPRVV